MTLKEYNKLTAWLAKSRLNHVVQQTNDGPVIIGDWQGINRTSEFALFEFYRLCPQRKRTKVNKVGVTESKNK